jgi:hypothetical protein
MMGFEGRRRWRQQVLFKLHAKPHGREGAVFAIGCSAAARIAAERIRIQNLRFAHFLCGAQEMSGVIKR